MIKFTVPRNIFYGEGALKELGKLEDRKRAVIVSGGSSMERFGFLDSLQEVLLDAGIEFGYIRGIEPDPSIETVMDGAGFMLEYEPDLIIAIGGGSTIDAAKAMWVFYEHPELEFEEVRKMRKLPKLRSKAILAALPSTSGTATEVTSAAVITDYARKIKYPLVGEELVPDLAILDTDLPQTMPKKLVAYTGMDALTHAIEAYIARNRSVITNGLAKESIMGIYDNLMESYRGDREARARMHMAQSLAGMAFSNAGLGIAHSIAHQIGAEFGLAHGLCNAVLLPYVLSYNGRLVCKELSEIARMLGLEGGSQEQLKSSLIKSISCLNKDLSISPSFKDHGILEEDFLDKLDLLTENAMKDGNTFSNPRKPSFDEMKLIIKASYYGDSINF